MLTPSMTGRVKFATNTAPRPPLAIWFQIRHHQGNSGANGRRWFAFIMAAILAGNAGRFYFKC
jgi:hypothetical protein